jgi:hypothetical protein
MSFFKTIYFIIFQKKQKQDDEQFIQNLIMYVVKTNPSINSKQEVAESVFNLTFNFLTQNKLIKALW